MSAPSRKPKAGSQKAVQKEIVAPTQLFRTTIADEISAQKQREPSKQEVPQALARPITAATHNPVYRMHRYFARRPWNVFAQIIKHYTEPGQIILDPFCGGGVTVVEGLKLRRRVIGVDLNPMATFITRTEIEPVDVEQLQRAFHAVQKRVQNEIESLYLTCCTKCGSKKAIAEWYELSNTLICPNVCCKVEVVIAKARKLRGRVYECPSCKGELLASECKRGEPAFVRVRYSCGACGKKEMKLPDEFDAKQDRSVESHFRSILSAESLEIPDDEFPDADRQREDALYQKGIKRFCDMFSKRNLVAVARLKKAILETSDEKIRCFLLMTFSSALFECADYLCHIKDGSVVKPGHHYWVPEVFATNNVWQQFERRFEATTRGKTDSQESIGEFTQFGTGYADLQKEATCLLLTQSSHKLPIPNHTVDGVVTDPPFGGNVQYAELSDFWVVWLKEILGVKGLIDNSKEAVQTRHSGFEGEKSLEHYEEMLFSIFKECHRVLKPNGWMVMTFHNRDLAVWMALHRAAKRAGFKLPSAEESRTRGMLYQPPIEAYTTTLHQQPTGAMLGDFILSFKREDVPSVVEGVLTALSTDEERGLRERIESFILYQGGADENAIMTCLIPYLGETGLIHRIGGLDFQSFLKTHFFYDKTTGKWFNQSQMRFLEKKGEYRVRPFDYIPAENAVSDLVRSYLKQHKQATMDDILNLIYTTMVNSHRPGMQAVANVMNRICELKTFQTGERIKRFYVLKKEHPVATEGKEVRHSIQKNFFGHGEIASDLTHNEIIQLLCNYALEWTYQIHVGETEQNKVPKFRELSTPMQDRTRFGIANSNAFERIKEIDCLYLMSDVIQVAFEVATSIGTAGAAINDRYRNLFAALPNLTVKCFVVVKDTDAKKAGEMLYSAANVRDGLVDKIRLLKLSELTNERLQELIK